jgi:hypothetical protein
MKPLNVIVVLLVAAAIVFALRPGLATDYANNPNPACRLMRNIELGAPYPDEPNRAETRAAMAANTVPSAYPKAFRLLGKIDSEGSEALVQLPSTLPRIDLVIDRHIINLVWARSVLGVYFEIGRVGEKDPAAAAAAYQRAIDTSFVDDRGCKHWVLASLETYKHLAGMYLYGSGVPADPAKAREVLVQGGAATAPALAELDQKKLPGTYRELVTPPPPAPQPGPRTEDLQNALLKWFGIEIDPGPGPWFGILLSTLLCVIVLSVVAYTAWEMGANARANGASGQYSVAAAYEILHAAFNRLDLLFKALFALFIGLTLLRYFLGFSSSWAFSPWVNAVFDYALILIMIAVAGRGLFAVVEALHRKRTVQNTHVHGDARPASESEAEAAARSDTKPAPHHDQTFPD